MRPDDRVRTLRYHSKAGVSQQRGQAVPGGTGWHDPVLIALHDQDGNGDPGNVSAEILRPGSCTAECRGRRHPDGSVEAVLPRLVTDPAAAEQVNVVIPVQVGLDCRWAV